MKSIEEMDVHELRNRKDEMTAELRAVVARLQELERIGLGLEPLAEAEPKPEVEPKQSVEPKPNAQPEGADA
jgi:hypothetical protein